jgi:hypothetical protein
VGWDWVPRYCGHFWPIVQTPDDRWGWLWNEEWQGKLKYSEKTCPSATLSTTKSHMTRAGLEPRTSMCQVGFEPTIPVFERAKTVHASDRAATVIGLTTLPTVQILQRQVRMNGNGCERKRSSPDLWYSPGIYLQGFRKNVVSWPRFWMRGFPNIRQGRKQSPELCRVSDARWERIGNKEFPEFNLLSIKWENVNKSKLIWRILSFNTTSSGTVGLFVSAALVFHYAS